MYVRQKPRACKAFDTECAIEIIDVRPCKGKNVNICVGEGCYGEACIKE